MGAFISISDLQNYYQDQDLVRLSDEDDGTATSLDTTIVNECIEYAEAKIKALVQNKYKISVWTASAVPVIIKKIAVKLAFTELMQRKLGANSSEFQASYELCERELKDIREGRMLLDTTPPFEYETRKVENTAYTNADVDTIDDMSVPV